MLISIWLTSSHLEPTIFATPYLAATKFSNCIFFSRRLGNDINLCEKTIIPKHHFRSYESADFHTKLTKEEFSFMRFHFVSDIDLYYEINFYYGLSWSFLREILTINVSITVVSILLHISSVLFGIHFLLNSLGTMDILRNALLFCFFLFYSLELPKTPCVTARYDNRKSSNA